jgi:hypothetical protein
LYAVRSTSTKHVLTCLKDFINDRGLPQRIISDRGTAYTSHDFESFCLENGITHVLNATKNPHGNGMVERANSSILNQVLLHIKTEDHKDWDSHLKSTQRCLNAATNKATTKSPFYLVHGYQPNFVDGVLRPLHVQEEQPGTPPQQRFDEATNNILSAQEKMKQQYDSHKHPAPKYNVGDIIVIRSTPVSTGHPNKTSPRFKGPYVITSVLPHDVYRVQWLRKPGRENYYTTVHVARTKIWHPSVSDDIQYDSDSDSDSDLDSVLDVPNVPTIQAPKAAVQMSDQPHLMPRMRRPPKHLQDYVTKA